MPQTMNPGLYIVRMPHRGAGTRLIVESCPMKLTEDREYSYLQAEKWRDFIQNGHPLDEVFIIERPVLNADGENHGCPKGNGNASGDYS